MARYRSRPAEIEADQWFPGKDVRGVEFGYEAIDPTDLHPTYRLRAYVTTIHGQRSYLDPGDWVADEGDGVHFYPIKPDKFEKRWDPIRES
jgi:hypothetical protein